MDPSNCLATETSLATLKVDLSEATGSVQEQYDTVLLGYLCVSLVDKSRFGFVSHYIQVMVGPSVMCLWCNACDIKLALYPLGVGPNQILLWCWAQSGFLGMGVLLEFEFFPWGNRQCSWLTPCVRGWGSNSWGWQEWLNPLLRVSVVCGRFLCGCVLFCGFHKMEAFLV